MMLVMDYIFSLVMSYGIPIIIVLGIASYIWRLKPKNKIILGVLPFVMYGCWQVVYPSGSFRYKLTLVVDDNGKQITSSAVREIFIQTQPRLPEAGNYVAVKGEAVVIDLGKRGVLFALLRSKDSVDYGYRIVFDNFYVMGASTAKGIEFYKNLKAKKELSFDKLPMLVYFRDINDPKTVELVDPNDLEKTFGKGVKLVSATLEMSDEGVTKKINSIIHKASWKEHGYAEWKRSLPYGHPLDFGWEDFDRNF